jgi:putative SbcD/Mre11-related phosphoesterase
VRSLPFNPEEYINFRLLLFNNEVVRLVYKNIKFVYNEPALIAYAEGAEHLVVGDLHIGMELAISRKGIHLFGATERMAKRVKMIMKDFGLRNIIILGDVKESILYPEAAEVRLIKEFFRELDGYEIRIVSGNHDAHLNEIIDREILRELVVGEFGFIHGNRRVGENMIGLDYIMSAHEHLSARIVDKNGAVYNQKVWAISKLNKKEAMLSYEKFNKDIRLVSIPAFNELIMGTALEKGKKRMNPQISGGIFTNRGLEVYNLMGQSITSL